jgi:hypothetical protein
MPATTTHAQEIKRIRERAVELSRELTIAVADAREAGYSWATITGCLALPSRYASLGHCFPTGASTSAVRSYFIDRGTVDGRTIS